MIFHAKKTGHFVMVDKAAINDPRLSLKAKGLLCYLLSKPPDWRPQIQDICNHCSDGEAAVRSALKELAKFGYAKLLRQQGDAGRWEGSFWTIIEKPSESSQPAEIAVSRISENRHLKIVRKNKSNKNEGDLRGRERILSDWPLKPVQGWTPPDPEVLKKECREMVADLLSGHIASEFLEQWERRIEASPWRTCSALGDLMDVVAGERAEGITVLKNRGGYANWWYLNAHKTSKELKAHGIYNPRN